jgi:hypothetical protein
VLDFRGVSTVDGSERSLGELPELAGACAWNTHVMICPVRTGFRAYRFAST